MTTGTLAPTYESDLFSDAAILDPYDHYRAMRSLGPICYLPSEQCYAAVTFDAVREALLSPDRFISGKGISLNSVMNEAVTTSIITSDGPAHAFIRKIEAEPLAPRALNELRETIFKAADKMVEDLLSSGNEWHDTVSDIAQHLPLTIVMQLGGLPPVGREQMLHWAATVFNLQGPMNERGKAALPALHELISYVTKDIDRNSVAPGSWAARAFRLADEGVIPPEMVADVLIDFIAPSLDTTIAATGNLLMLLGQNPDQWTTLRQNRTKIPNAINEALRIETPIRCFSRLSSETTTVCGVTVPAGERLAIFYASANRDEGHFDQPDRFDITRHNASQHLAFGAGVHQCIGNNLARLEIMAVLNAMLDRIEHFEIGAPVYSTNNLLRTLKSMPIRLLPAAQRPV